MILDVENMDLHFNYLALGATEDILYEQILNLHLYNQFYWYKVTVLIFLYAHINFFKRV